MDISLPACSAISKHPEAERNARAGEMPALSVKEVSR